MYLIANGKVITRDDAMPYIEDGGVVVEGTKIIELGETAALKAKYPDAEFIDAKGNVIDARIHKRAFPYLFRPCPRSLYKGL